jgi:hypothetical protein
MEFLFYVTKSTPYTFSLAQLGYGDDEAVPVHDIWAGEDLGTVIGTLTTTVPSHGVRLLRLGNKATIGIGESVKMEELNNESVGIFDLQGRRVRTPQQGIYLVNGKKVAIR